MRGPASSGRGRLIQEDRRRMRTDGAAMGTSPLPVPAAIYGSLDIRATVPRLRVSESTTAGGLRLRGHKREAGLREYRGFFRRRRRSRRRGGGRMRRRRGECTSPCRRRTPVEMVRGAPKTAPLRQSRARRSPNRRHSANLHRISRRTRSTEITLKG